MEVLTLSKFATRLSAQNDPHAGVHPPAGDPPP